eukprot:6056149-Amphidinium_carterae.2
MLSRHCRRACRSSNCLCVILRSATPNFCVNFSAAFPTLYLSSHMRAAVHSVGKNSIFKDPFRHGRTANLAAAASLVAICNLNLKVARGASNMYLRSESASEDRHFQVDACVSVELELQSQVLWVGIVVYAELSAPIQHILQSLDSNIRALLALQAAHHLQSKTSTLGSTKRSTLRVNGI